MKRVLLLTGVLLTLATSVAFAGGVNFNWGTVCYTEAPVNSITFACNTNSPSQSWSMISSFVSYVEVSDMVGFELTMEAQTCGGHAIPDWWKLGASPDCRAGRAQFSADFSTAPQVRCFDWAGGQAVAAYIPGSYAWSGDKVNVLAGAAIDANTPFDLRPGVEYYAGNLTILNSKTVGAGACTGCPWGMYWDVPLITVAGLGGTRIELTWPVPGGNNWLTFNVNNCASPARGSTWGQIKSLYR